jgi:hypothetical protein
MINAKEPAFPAKMKRIDGLGIAEAHMPARAVAPKAEDVASAIAWMRAQEKALGLQDAGGESPLGLSRFLAGFIAAPKVDAPADQTAAALWHLLDAIDTQDDASGGDDAHFRAAVRKIQRRRFEVCDAPAAPAEDAPCPILEWCMNRELFDAANASHDAPYYPEDIVAALTEYEAELVAAAEIAHREGVRLYSAREIKAQVQSERALAYEEGQKAAEARLAREAADPAEVEALAQEGLEYFDRAGGAGDRKYVAAIREALARRLRPVVVDAAMVERVAISMAGVWTAAPWERFSLADKVRWRRRAAAALKPEGRSDG